MKLSYVRVQAPLEAFLVKDPKGALGLRVARLHIAYVPQEITKGSLRVNCLGHIDGFLSGDN